MPSYSREIKIPGKSSQELYDIISREIDRFGGSSIAGKVEISRDPAQRRVNAKSSMFSATLVCADEKFILDAKISLMAMAFRSRVDAEIDRWVSETFGNRGSRG